MVCPVCSHENFISLSICSTCGNTTNEPVLEKVKTSSIMKKSVNSSKLKSREITSTSVKPSKQIKLKPSPKSVVTERTNTSEIVSKTTNRTLVDFQSKESKLPEWRLHLQNAVQKRYKKESNSSIKKTSVAMALTPDTATALTKGTEEVKNHTSKPNNAHLANALKRIEVSRNKYYISEDKPLLNKQESNPQKAFPYKIASRNEQHNQIKNADNRKVELIQVTSKELTQKARKSIYDTSELDPDFVPAKAATSFENKPVKTYGNKLKKEKIEETDVAASEETEIIEDFAPLSVRFNAGLFDLIIGSFASLILLSPFILTGGSWFTAAGIFGFLAVCSVVMFIYLTTTIGLFSKTFGMHLFSIEMININGEEYPTFHQSAVSSSVYLLSMAFCGIGFLTTLIDEEGRAIHDLVSGTIIVKEI